MTPVKILTLEQTPSTNSAAAELGDRAGHGTVVSAISQTAGRGQRGNTWESAPGLNATFSLVLRPHNWPARRQFELSMAISVALTRSIADLLRLGFTDSDAADPDALPVRIKWPNDIYIGDKKVCGILIENTLQGAAIARLIMGAGVNLNQRCFVSDAPNPVSLNQINGHEYDVADSVRHMARAVTDAVDAYVATPDPDALLRHYHSLLWRNDGAMHRWLDTASGNVFTAAIHHVAPDGMLTLSTSAPEARLLTFAFKAVHPIL